MRTRERWLEGCRAALLGISLLAGPAVAQPIQDRPVEEQPPPAGIDPGTIFVPFWTDSLEGRSTAGPGGRRVGVDVRWAGVALGTKGATPERGPSGASVLLEEFRLSTAPRRPDQPRQFVAIVRVQPFHPGVAPLLEVVDPETAIQSQSWGRLLRRTGDAAEFMFVVREPIPPASGPVSPIARATGLRGDEERRFDLRLSLDASPPRGRVPQSTRR
jgi:hypothetical protein